ncbi:MATE family efflux transporter [uncultured Gemmiger sp.]|uniref:MATE family efflux transporter n=1 Tax=uncultured Gemmiger sp. TaxID=1623490 RepID=UPI0025EDDABE|nr:MATE family efflux transporter [uncultured Gemmiger sp.]
MTTAHKSRVLDMTRGDPFRLVLQFSLPLFCSNLLQQVYNLTDTALAGHLLGSAALAEIGATAALYGLIMNFAFGMNNGLALTVSRCFGAGEQEGIRRAVGWMVTLSAAVSLVLTTVSLLGRGALLQVLQVPAEVWDGAAAYLTVILLGIPLTMLYNMEAALLRAVGNSVTPLLFLLFSSVLNVGLDAAFMGPLGMGVRGAAVATVLAQGISAVLGAAYLVRSYPELHFAPAHLKKSTRRAVMNMFWAGMSMGLMSAIYNLGSVALQSSINALGSVYITAQTAARRMAEMYFIPGGALGISVATFSSQNLGAGRRSRIGQSVRAALKIYFVWWLFVLAFTFLLGEPVLRLITGSSDARIISNAMLYLKISVPIIPPMAVLVILRNMLQGIRHTVEPLLASALELIGKVIFAVWLVPVWGYRAVCFCEPTTWIICFVFILLAVWRCRSDLQDACPPDRTPA